MRRNPQDPFVLDVGPSTTPAQIMEWYFAAKRALQVEFKGGGEYPIHRTKPYRIQITYSQPTALHYTRYYTGDKTDTVHLVKDLFFSDSNRIAYVPPKKTHRGYFLPMDGLARIEIVVKAEDHALEWDRIATSMVKYRINYDVAQAIADHLAGKEDYIKGFQNYWTRYDKPRIASFKDVVGSWTIPQMVEYAKAHPDKYAEHGKYYADKPGSRRDRSISLWLGADGSVNYTAASEYAGTGNGDYYVMFSPTQAFYAETD